MKRVNFAIVLSHLTLSSAVFSQDNDLAKLTTKDGKTYQEVQIIDADKDGLLFRHKDGITKESFQFLTANIRDMFEPVAQVPHIIEVDLGGSKAITKNIDTPPKGLLPEMVLTFVIRRPVCSSDPSFCGIHRSPKSWPTQWHRFDDAHLLTNPAYRAAATRNFLLATGLLPTQGAIPHHSANPYLIRF